MRHPLLKSRQLLFGCLALIAGGTLYSSFTSPPEIADPILFVSRQIPCCGSVYMAGAKALPGVGPLSKYQVAAPGYLCLLQPDGTIDTLIDGSNPTAESLFLIDVSAPAVSWDAQRIAFAGLPEGDYEEGGATYISREHNAWRIYVMHVDGTGLRQLTGLAGVPGSDQDLAYQQFSPLAWNGLQGYDDTDPVWLPDGRICFSSTRFPTLAMYNAVRTSNLYVVNEDGTGLHRITSEKNGADRPVVDPQTGKIVYARWWRNFYWPYDGMESVASTQYPQGWLYHQGLTSDLYSVIDGEQYMFNNNAFALTEINPDGSGQQLFSGYFRETSANSCYGGSFDAEGEFVGNWFPIEHQTESSGFGGIKRYYRQGRKAPQGLVGITDYGNLDYYVSDPPSYGILKGRYAAEPFVLPDGRILVSMAPDPQQDYGLYVLNGDGSDAELLLDIPGMTELSARLVRPRPIPPVIPDRYTAPASLLPPTGLEDLRKDGTFTFDCRNIHFNAPVDDPVISAPAVGDIGSVRFYAAPLLHQQYGSVEALDFPLLYNEIAVDAFGRVLETDAPAHVPLFEQGRAPASRGYRISRTGGGIMDGAAQVMGFNFARPGQQVTCVGCHQGHSRIPVPTDPQELLFTNLAPGARIKASSAMNPPGYAIDRKNFTAKSKHWFSAEPADPNQQWLELDWRVPIWIKSLVLHNVPAGFDITIQQSRVRLFSDSLGQDEIFQQLIDGPLSDQGTTIPLPQVMKAQSMKLEFLDCKGGIYHWDCASIGDIEVIASPVEPERFQEITDCQGWAYGPHRIDSCGQCLLPEDPLFNDCLSSLEPHASPLEALRLHPNPASTDVHVGGPSALFPLRFEAYSLEGRPVASGRIDAPDRSVDVSGWKPGAYLIRFRSGDHVHTRKVVRTP